MAKKAELKDGLSALFGEGAALKPTPEEIQAEKERQEEEDLINSVEDEELKQELLKKRSEKRGRPRKDAVGRGEKQDEAYERMTNLVRREQAAKLREIARREGYTIKHILEAIFGIAIRNYERTHGEVIPTQEELPTPEELSHLFTK